MSNRPNLLEPKPRPPAPASGRIPAIDVVKGLAVVGVIAQHALTRQTMDDTGADFWFRQSVPVLFVLMGFNAARSSLRRRRPRSWRRTARATGASASAGSCSRC